MTTNIGCVHTLQFCRIRLARLDSNGVPSPGADNLYVSDQQISLAVTLNELAGVDFTQPTGCGEIAYSFQEPGKVKNLDLVLNLATADPELVQLLIGGDLITSGGEVIGFALPAVGTTGNINGTSIEAWTKNITGSDVDPSYPYIRFVFPKTRWTPDAKTLDNNPINHQFKGVGYENPNWYDGPNNDWPDTDTSYRLYSYAGDTSLPTPFCGTQALAAS